MSIQHVSAVLDCRDPRLSGTRKLVLVTLANRTDEEGSCWPSQELLAAECGISIRALSDHLKGLETDGFIVRMTQHRGRGNGSRTIYNLRVQALKFAPENIAPAELAPAKNVECTGSRPRVTNLQEPTLIEIDTRAPARTVRGTVLPDDWLLPDAWVEAARQIAIKAKKPLSEDEIIHEADKFRDYWHAKPGAAGRKADWSATWRNWIRSCVERRPAPRDASGYHSQNSSGEHRGGSIADAAIRARLRRQNGNGFHDQRGRGSELPAEAGWIDGEFRRVG